MRGTTLRRTLLHSVSLTAVLIAAASRPAAAGTPFRSLAQALASQPSAAVTAAQTAGGATAANAAGLGAQNLANAAKRFRSLNDALAGMSYTGPSVPDGVAVGGLQQAPGTSSGGTLWSGASTTLGTQTVNGVHDVTVTQTGSVADLTWQTFNIGAHTKLIFNQSAGGTLANTWIAINSIQDPNENPTTILGQIIAPGKIYILNPNGVLFGAGSQVNVGSLIAATADIAQAQFTRNTNGIITGFSLYGSATGTTTADSYTPTFENASNTASIVVQAGATIETAAPSGNTTGGYVMLLAGNVRNDGIIATPSGQTVLAAGNNFILQPGYSTTGNVTASVIGSEVAVSNDGSITGTGTSALGAATNTGIILADQGDITMVGHLVTQAGVILSTTTVNNRGTVHLLTDRTDTTASVVLAPGSVTEVLPEDNGQTALNSQRETDITNSGSYNVLRAAPLSGPSLNDVNTLPDQIAESRVEISTGGAVLVEGGALALAQGGQVAVAGTAITLDNGATLDVSGTNASLAANFNSLFIEGIVPYYLRDSAANRTGGLEFSNVYIDERTLIEITSGTYAGNIYTAGGLLEVSGNLGLIGHGINEWSAIGGQVTLQGAANGGYSSANVITPGTVTVSQGATINLTGGTVSYGAGLVKQSYVETVDGQVYNINNAPGNLVYAGVYTGVVVDHARWQVTDTYVNPLLTPSEIYEPEYTIGRDAGTLTVTAGTATLDGTVDAGVTVGVNQTVARPTGVTDPFLLAQTVTPLAGALLVGDYAGGAFNTPFDSNILIGTGNSGKTPVLNELPDSVAGTISIGSAFLTDAGFAGVTLSTAGDIDVTAPIALAPDGTVVLSGNTIEVNANITAHAGTIVLTNLFPGSTDGNPASGAAGSITLSTGATLDASGEWTNLALQPNNTISAGYANGGSVTIIGTGGVDLAQGSEIDVSSGGVLSAASKLTTASGGSIAVSADIIPTLVASLQSDAVTYEATLLGYGSGGAGTLSLSAPDVVLGTGSAGDGDTTVVIGQSLFGSGFADYVLNGLQGLSVDPNVQIDVTRPIYVLTNPSAPTGSAATSPYGILLPVLFGPAKGNDSIIQRAGASVTLSSSINPGVFNGGGGTVTIGAGSSITVDPRQSITVDGYGQITDLGTLTAHGGTITVSNTRYEVAPSDGSHSNPSNYVDGLSVWIGAGAVVDTSGIATVLTDGLHRRFGQAEAGGSIFLGGLGALNSASPESTYAQVIVRPGAVLNASGADATVDVSAGLTPTSIVSYNGPVTLAGNGGLIAARSYSGVALDGTMLAAGAGTGAAGGTLSMRLDPQDLNQFYDIPQSYIAPSQILISDAFIQVQTQNGLQPGSSTDPATVSLGRISQQQLTAGGFTSLVLYAQDNISFDGAVSLKLGGSVRLESGIIGDTTSAAAVSITAPYVDLIGFSNSPNANGGLDTRSGGGVVQTPENTTGVLTVNADLIDFSNALILGGVTPLPTAGNGSQPGSSGQGAGSGSSTVTTDASAFGFTTSTFNSAGDIRFTAGAGGSGTLASSGNIVFDAAQVYPTTSSPGAPTSATVLAGLNPYLTSGVNQLAGGTITVLRQSGATPAPPYSIGGTLALFADSIVQDGVLRAPEGVIELGEPRTSGDSNLQLSDTVTLGPNSITSVSLAGQVVPYGGTVDGVNYLYNGQAVSTFAPVVAIGAVNFTADPGSVIDLRGGGTLAGAGFIAGRGGSANVNQTPLLNSGSGTVAANTTDPVYAILPGYGSAYAPVAPADSGYSAPGVGEQITIAAGEVPGLAAGTYTLLPAYYDLLPGGFRVELTGSTIAPGTAQNFGNFTTVAAVTVGTANTGIVSSVPQAALITSEKGVNQLSQFDEENYSTFETTASATFDAPRPLLPQDAKTLLVTLNTPMGTISGTSAISLDPATLQDAQASGGYGATMEISARGNDSGAAAIEVLGPGDVLTQLPSSSGTGTIPTLAVAADTLSALDLPRLVIGGTLSTSSATPNEITFNGIVSAVVIDPHADLTAGDVLLIAQSNGGSIGVSGGATISTIGENNTAYGLAQGYYFNTDNSGAGSPILEVSANQVVYTPNQFGASGAAITVGAGTTLAGGGSLNFVGPSGTSVQVGSADLSAQSVVLQVADINIGTQANLANFASLLPAGLTLTDTAFNTLLQDATTLILTAQQAINFVGSADLKSATTDLVLNTPAIYGYGISSTENGNTITTDTGAVNITSPVVTWGGVGVASTLQNLNLTTVSATPGGRIAGSLTTSGTTLALTTAISLDIGGAQSVVTSGGATKTVASSTIDLGYGPDAQVDDQVQLDRLAVGFANVTLQATSEITANNQSALSVYLRQLRFGDPGTFGNLTLSAPVITAASGAVLGLTAGGTLTANAGTGQPGATTGFDTLGAQIDLSAGTVDTSTSFALASGELSITSQGNINLASGTNIDLSGRSTKLFDQTAQSAGGTLLLQAYAGDNGNITESAGATINVSAPDANAGSVSATASGGSVAFSGTLDGSATGTNAGGSFTVFANTLGANTAINEFDALNTRLDTGGFTALRGFELASGNILVDQTVQAHTVEIAADAGNITVTGTINASGASPGNISLSAGNTLLIGSNAVLDAHAADIAVDSYGNPIDADNRAEVTLTSAGGTVVLDPGATINVSYAPNHFPAGTQIGYAVAITTATGPVPSGGFTSTGTLTRDGVVLFTAGQHIPAGFVFEPNDQLSAGFTLPVAAQTVGNQVGQVVINAPRLGSSGALSDVAVEAPGALNIVGAASIDVYGFKTYTPTDGNGTIVQDNGTGTLSTSYSATNSAGTLGILQIGLDNTAFMQSVDNDATALSTQLAGLVHYSSTFNILPGVTIASSATSSGNLTITGDLDFSTLRYTDPVRLFGIATTGVTGSGEPGSINFRASNDLIINGSISDGFLAPPDTQKKFQLPADKNGWEFLIDKSGGYESSNADILLPAGSLAVYTSPGGKKFTSSQVYLIGCETDPTGGCDKGPTTTFDTTRPISLNYAIVIRPADVKANVVIPFALVVGATSAPIPAGGWIATESVRRDGQVLYQAGQLIPAGFEFLKGDVLNAGTVLPISVQTIAYTVGANGKVAEQVIPAGTPLDIFDSSSISLATNVLLPANAYIPAFTSAVFGGYFERKGETQFQIATEVAYRPTQSIDGQQVQGYLYPLAQMMAPGMQSWSMNFVAGANLGAAAANSVLASTTLSDGVFTVPPTSLNAAPGSLLIEDQHYYKPEKSSSAKAPVLAFSVIRTGTGNLSLEAGGNVDQTSLYGIYTAGTQDVLSGSANAQFNTARQNQSGSLLLPADSTVNKLIRQTYQAYYPNDGGNVVLLAQGNVTSDVFADSTGNTGASASDNVGNWLWRQGSTQLGQPTAWWINFGTLVAPLSAQGTPAGTGVQMTGFTGIGALGGGNVTVTIGENAGQITDRSEGGGGAGGLGPTFTQGEGLVIAVGSTGRLLPGASGPITTGGGDVTITIGGTLNPIDASAYGIGATAGSNGLSGTVPSVNGDVIDLRGNVEIAAGAIGRIDYQFDVGTSNLYDPRAANPFAYNNGVPNGGIEVVPGDGTVTITTDRDLVLGGATDPGRVAEQNVTSLEGTNIGTASDAGGYTGFTLWQPTTSITLFSSGGNVTPTTLPNQQSSNIVLNDSPTDYRSIYPAILTVTAATGDIIYGQDGGTPGSSPGSPVGFTQYSLETMPSPDGQVEFLAGGSIIANGYAIDMSGANPVGLSSIIDPAFTSNGSTLTGELTNIRNGIGTNQSPLALFALEADTPTTDVHANDPSPALFYAAGGDIVNFQTGETLYFGTGSNEPQSSWYIAAKPVWIIAENDIVSTGTRPDSYPNAAVFAVQENQQSEQFTTPITSVDYWSSGNLFFNTSAASLSEVIAGRDILSAYAYVGGPGALDVEAGRNLYQAAYSAGSQQFLYFGSLKSLGDNLITGSQLNTSAGAGINVDAGIGTSGPDYTAFASLFIDPANQGQIKIPTQDAGSKAAVQAAIAGLLATILKTDYGYTGTTPAAAYTFFTKLTPAEQEAVSEDVFFAVLQYSGAAEANPSSIYYKSYVLGRQAIDTLFPSIGTQVTNGTPVGYTGAITMYSGTAQLPSKAPITTTSGADATFDGGIATLFGGSVQVLDPGGATVFGITGGPAPGNSSGIVTYGAGAVNIYALSDVLLGQSRIFTTGGGNIVIWSSEGDINAGIGAKTTVVYNPPVLVYDNEGDITETPPADTSGAGIATLQPLPDIPAGDVNLIAPGGTIDAGEAGIRVSGNLVLAASRVVGTANISVKGSTAGAPTVSVASLGAVEAANATAGAASSTAQSQGQKGDTTEAASVLDVEVVSIGGTYDEEQKRKKRGL